MEQIFSRPEIQSAVLPFIVALLGYGGLRKLTPTAWLWAVFAAFLVSSALINGITINPLTGTRKIILLVLASLILAGLAPYLVRQVKLQRAAAPVLVILALLWVFWKVVARMEAGGIVMFLAGGVGLVLWLTWTFDHVASNKAQLHGAGFSLLLGTGLSATAAASALLGQLALALAAASGGVLLAWIILGGSAKSGNLSNSFSTLPYVLSAALIGLAAVMFARLPWYALIPLAAIPLATSLVPGNANSRFVRALIGSLPGLTIALAVSFWVWQAGSSNSSGY